jgi:site-specific recombinase XerD
MSKPMRRQRAGAQSDAPPTPGLEAALSSWTTWLLNCGRSEAYVVNLNFFLGAGNHRTAWRPLVQFMRDLNIHHVGQLNQANLDAWLAHQREHQSDYSYAKAVELLMRWLRWLEREGDLPTFPMRRMITPHYMQPEIKVFNADEMDRLYKMVSKENPRDFAIFMLLCDTGMRASEVTGLRVEDVRLDRSEVAVRGKGKKFRTITLTDSLGPIRRYLQVRPSVKTESLFISFYSTPVYAGGKARSGPVERRLTGKLPWSEGALSSKGLQQLVSKWGRLAKITEARCSPHTFRHWYAIEYLRGGGDLFSLQRILGHANLKMTQRYAKMVDIDVRERQQKFSPARRFQQPRYKKAV